MQYNLIQERQMQCNLIQEVQEVQCNLIQESQKVQMQSHTKKTEVLDEKAGSANALD